MRIDSSIFNSILYVRIYTFGHASSDVNVIGLSADMTRKVTGQTTCAQSVSILSMSIN